MTLTILEQYRRVFDEGEGDIVCPRCGTEIGQFDIWATASRYIESGKCPICDCNEDENRGRLQWCGHCRGDDCEGKREVEEERVYGLHIDYQIKVRKEMELA